MDIMPLINREIHVYRLKILRSPLKILNPGQDRPVDGAIRQYKAFALTQPNLVWIVNMFSRHKNTALLRGGLY